MTSISLAWGVSGSALRPSTDPTLFPARVALPRGYPGDEMGCRLLLMTTGSLRSPGISFIKRKASSCLSKPLKTCVAMRKGSMCPIIPQNPVSPHPGRPLTVPCSRWICLSRQRHPGVFIRRIPLPRPHQCPVDREPSVVSRAHTATPTPQTTGPAAGRVRPLCVTGVALPFLCGMKPHFVSHKLTCGSEMSHNRHPVYIRVYCIGVLTYATGLAGTRTLTAGPPR